MSALNVRGVEMFILRPVEVVRGAKGLESLRFIQKTTDYGMEHSYLSGAHTTSSQPYKSSQTRDS